jgi:ABC-type polysaccharide/polyol phosphate transport system ATPase subunit
MAHNVVIRAEALGKKYVVRHVADRHATLRDVLAHSPQNAWRKIVDWRRRGTLAPDASTEEFWALKDVTFDVKRGEVLGVIGRNGAGKSTLLKVLSRITEPTRGRVTISGRVASLVDVGTGFHPELTGRENIYLNGTILGMARSEVKRKFDEIVAFGQVERFLDTPVKRYSSGMYVRLGFSVAAHLESDILIVDEVLAVGDAEFQRKCRNKIVDMANSGRTVLFVSHNMAAIETLCPRSIRLESGELVDDGDTDAVVARYSESLVVATDSSGRTRAQQIQPGLTIESVAVGRSVIRSGDAAEIAITFFAEGTGRIRECAVLIYSVAGLRVAIVDTRESGIMPLTYREGRVRLIVRIASLPFVEGGYTVGLHLATDEFVGNVLELSGFRVEMPRSDDRFVPYSVEWRGILALRSVTSVALQEQESMILAPWSGA